LCCLLVQVGGYVCDVKGIRQRCTCFLFALNLIVDMQVLYSLTYCDDEGYFYDAHICGRSKVCTISWLADNYCFTSLRCWSLVFIIHLFMLLVLNFYCWFVMPVVMAVCTLGDFI
jgi:hypothetical protein